jgi:hypothetical protein
LNSLIGYLGFSQNIERVEVHGKIIVDSVDVEGVTVYNTSSNRGTITDNNGQFSIEIALNDRIELSALQFEKFVIIINEDIIESRVLTVFLVERINRLDEVVILPYGLSGNLVVDMESIKTFNPDMDALYFGIQNMDEYEFSADYKSAVVNLAMEDGRYFNGADAIQIIDLLVRPLFNFRAKGNEEEISPYQDLTTKFSMAYLMNNLQIPEGYINEFIYFVEEGNFDRNLMNTGNEIQFLEYLIARSQDFKNIKGLKE